MAYRGVNHDLRSVDGRYILMPPYKGGQSGWGNLALPNPYLVDQAQQYPTGTKFRDGYRTFIYTYLDEASAGRDVQNSTGLGVIAENLPVDVTVVTALTKASTVTGTIAAATVDQFAGGYMSLYEATTGCRGIIHRIQSNTVRASGNSIFTLDEPLNYTGFSTSATCRVMADPYAKVRFTLNTRTSSANFDTLVGIWMGAFDADDNVSAEGDYGWIQTWGPCFCWAAVAYEGGTAFERDAYHQGGGDIQVNTSSDAHPGAQRVGFMVPASCADPGVSLTGSNIDQMEHVIWLQIEP